MNKVNEERENKTKPARKLVKQLIEAVRIASLERIIDKVNKYKENAMKEARKLVK